MKIVPIRDGENFRTLDVLRSSVAAAPNGINVDQMRKRIRVLDVLDKAAGDSFTLEDADHQTLVGVLNAQPWARADRELLALIDDVLNAKSG